MTDVQGKWALLTGASRGLGALSARFLARQGCNLVLHSRKLAHTEPVLRDVLALGVDAYAVEAELADIEQVRGMLAAIGERETPVSLVLNNAGVQVAYRDEYLNTPAEDFTTSFMINTIAPAMICYHYLPEMIQNGFGRIVNTTSGIRLDPQQAGYSASKAALDKFTVDLGSKVHGTGVMINLTDPGWCRTELGGPNAPNAAESVIPGVVVGVFADDQKSGRVFPAQDFAGMTLEQAVKQAETAFDSPY